MKMTGKVAMVTGAGHQRGIGRAIAVAMAREGADLVLADLYIEGAGAIAEEIRGLGRRALAVRTDITQEDQVNALAAAALREFGRIDILVNNAGIAHHHPLLEITTEQWDRMINVHLKGTFLCTKAVIPIMMEQRYGRIVSIASINAERGGGGMSGAHYNAAKAGIMGFQKTVARKFASYGITSNVVSPGYIDTDITRDYETDEDRAARRKEIIAQIPLGRQGTPEDIAEAVLFLASDSASFITGEVLDVNGGQHID